MKFLTTLFGFLLTLALLGLLGWGVYWAISFFSSRYAELSPAWIAGLAVISLALVFCSLVIAWSISNLGPRGGGAVYPEKAGAYELFVELWLGPDSRVGDPKEEETAERFWDLDRKLALWASEDVLKSYVDFQTAVQDPETAETELPAKATKVLMAMREDLGMPSTMLQPQALLYMLGENGAPDDEPSE